MYTTENTERKLSFCSQKDYEQLEEKDNVTK